MSDRTGEKKYTIVREHIRRISTRTTNRNKTYCSRCGVTPGKKSVCTGTYTPHNFMNGSGMIACSRCGKKVGERSVCTGTYTHHNFRTGMGKKSCSRCGIKAGERSVCTGTYTHHNFIST